MRLLSCYFAQYVETEVQKVSVDDLQRLCAQLLEPLFLFALTWSVTCTTNYEGRRRFDQFLRELAVRSQARSAWPSSPDFDVYDYELDLASG